MGYRIFLGSCVDDVKSRDFLVQREHQDLKRYAHGGDDHEEQEALQFELVHCQTIRYKVADKQCQYDGEDCQNQ